MNTVDLLGWLGAAFLAVCSFPQTLRNIKEGSARNLSPYFIWLWFFGEVFTLAYVLLGSFSWQLFFNYGLNLTFSVILLKLYYFPRKLYEEGNKES